MTETSSKGTVKETIIDARGKHLGRVATRAATILAGKASPAYAPHVVAEVRVVIEHASKILIPQKKREQKTYKRYSGYPGGLTHTPMELLIAKKGYGEVLRKAVYGMLPANRLRSRRMKHLIINE